MAKKKAGKPGISPKQSAKAAKKPAAKPAQSEATNGRRPTGDLRKRFNIDDDGVPHAIVSTLKEVALAFRVSYKVVETHWSHAMPKRKDGRYDLAAIHAWKYSRPRDPARMREGQAFQVLMGDGADPTNGDGGGTLAAMHMRRAQMALDAEAERLRRFRRENALAEADIMDRRDVEREFAWWFTAIRNTFQQIPEELEASFPDRRRREYVELLSNAIERKLIGVCRRGLIHMGLDEDLVFRGLGPMSAPTAAD